MVDIRSEVVGILIGGAPSPGINGVISAVTIEALNQNCTVVGFYEGFKRMKQGISLVTSLGIQDVSNIQDRGGSILRTSRKQVQGAKEVDNCLRVLELHRVRYFITIGGVDTAYSAFQIAAAAKKANVKLSVCHIPKTIFNDLPLPDGARSFGFSTAREVGMRLVSNFQKDSATMLRWYVLVVMGQKAGHLSLGIGKAAAATITCIPEEFKDKKVTFNMLCDLVEGSMYKRRALGKEYGIAILAEGLVDLMDKKEIEERWKDADNGHQDVGRDIVRVLMDRFKAKDIDATVVARHIGNELRAADPNSDDIELTRDLGFGAVRFLLEGGSNAMVSTKGDSIVAIPFEDIMDPKTGNTIVREVDPNSILYQVAQSYMIKLYKSDLADAEFLSKLAKTAEMTPEEFKKRFEYVAWADNPTQYPATLDMMSMKGWGDRIEEHKKKHAPVIVLERKPQALGKNSLAVPVSNATIPPQSPNTVLNEVSTYPKIKQTTSGD